MRVTTRPGASGVPRWSSLQGQGLQLGFGGRPGLSLGFGSLMVVVVVVVTYLACQKRRT